MNAFTSDLIDQGATFEELRQSINFLLAKEIFEIFLEIMGTRSPCGAFFIDFVESAQFQNKITILSLYPLSDLSYKVGYNLTSFTSCSSCISDNKAPILSDSLLSLYYD